MKRAQPEFQLSCVVADWLRVALPARAVWSHFPAGEARSAITGSRLKRMGTATGWADYLIIVDGNILGIELKAPNGKLSDAQAAFGDALTANGGRYQVCRSLDDVEAFLTASGVPLRVQARKVGL